MPFKSKSQLRTCYSTHKKGWNCKEWLSKTENICCLPEKKGSQISNKCRPVRKDERVVGSVKTGARGGKYFEIIEKNKGKVICVTKVYLSRKK